MNSRYIPDPSNYTMKANKTIATANPNLNPPQMPITSDVIAKLDSMTKDDLITLIKLVYGAIWGYAILTADEKREAMRLRVANIALTSTDNETVLKACNQWLDREEGKPMQRIENKSLIVAVDATKRKDDAIIEANNLLKLLREKTLNVGQTLLVENEGENGYNGDSTNGSDAESN